LQQHGQFAAQCRKSAGLKFNQQIVSNQINDKTIDRLFEAISRSLKPCAQIGMQCAFAQKTNSRLQRHCVATQFS
jgi:hypothetical protein